MKIKTTNRIRAFFVKKILALLYKIENIGNGYLTVSGESNFIKEVSRYYEGIGITFFDIGANIGDYTALLSQQRSGSTVDQYFLFEPQKSCFNDLKDKFSQDKRIILNNIGLSDIKTEAVIYKDHEKSGLTSLYKRNLEYYNHHMDIQEKIHLDTAENYIRENNIKKIHLIKIDVEGNEMNTLKGFGDSLHPDFIDFIQFEYGGANIDSHTNLLDFYTLLEPKGFKICKIMKKSLEYREYNPNLENFVCQNYVAISTSIFTLLLSK